MADGGRILFAAPSIALVSQARREWLRHTTRGLRCVVVCSNPTAGGRHENEDIRVSELECPVSTDPAAIARSLLGDEATHVVFCTYHSLGKVTEAQAEHGAPEFDLAIADEAHRTTGVLQRKNGDRKVDFQEFHDERRLYAKKRLYMTATPRIYRRSSKAKLDRKRVNKASNKEWAHPRDPEARVTKMKDGRTHMAHKLEQAVDMETGAVVAATVQSMDGGDVASMPETLGELGKDPKEVVADKGYHANATMTGLKERGVRSYVSEPDRGRRRWKGKREEREAIYANRRRVRGKRGKRLMKARGEKVERGFARMLDTGGLRRLHVRGREEI